MKANLLKHSKSNLIVIKNYYSQQKIMLIEIPHLYLKEARYLIKLIPLHEKTTSKWILLIHRFCLTKMFHLWHNILIWQLIKEYSSIFLEKTVLTWHKKKISVSNTPLEQYMKYIPEIQATTELSQEVIIIMVAHSSKKITEL